MTPTRTPAASLPSRTRSSSATSYKVDLTKFWGRHEIKVGVDWEDIDSAVEALRGRRRAADLQARSSPRRQQIYYRHRFYVDDRAPGFDRATRRPGDRRPADVEPRRATLVLRAGQLEGSRAIDAQRRRAMGTPDVKDRDARRHRADDNWAPRVGLVWDVARNGKSKLYAHFGRFYENIPMDINIRAFGGERPASATTSTRMRPTSSGIRRRRVPSLLGGRSAGRSGPEGPVHRRMAARRRVRGGAEPQRRHEVHVPHSAA